MMQTLCRMTISTNVSSILTFCRFGNESHAKIAGEFSHEMKVQPTIGFSGVPLSSGNKPVCFLMVCPDHTMQQIWLIRYKWLKMTISRLEKWLSGE
jgi:hypothetical protein